jgi:hypothetical protein
MSALIASAVEALVEYAVVGRGIGTVVEVTDFARRDSKVHSELLSKELTKKYAILSMANSMPVGAFDNEPAGLLR